MNSLKKRVILCVATFCALATRFNSSRRKKAIQADDRHLVDGAQPGMSPISRRC
jgi:hypothetical protein